eukprot:TRINITY_DN23703_c0_g1_i1.p1 TRINITY_DN23703_c0_g1~~TRINITY_DN23703_c0_g1_i1.p1  ORF type:complete len:2979 (-),score=657.34 TRINITY_DN23703_c0_g1_i1:1-8937(-)
MEVVVEKTSGIPEGSILSIRAGNVRRQGTLPADKPVRFASASLTDASPFKVDVFAPLGSSRVVLKPKPEHYTVNLGTDNGKPMLLDLLVKEIGGAEPEPKLSPTKKENGTATQAYLEQHEIVHFIQNLMTSMLADKPDDPYAYMSKHLESCRARPPSRAPSKPATPKQTKRAPLPPKPASHLTPHRKGFIGPAFVIEDFEGNLLTLRELQAADVVPSNGDIRKLPIDDLSKVHTSAMVDTPLSDIITNFIDRDAFVSQAIATGRSECFYQMARAGPRPVLHFEPKTVAATIVTCGGLCPGLNAVIRELVMMLNMYGVRKIYGIRGGYKGVIKPDTWMELTPDKVQDIHNLGGTILVSDRGNPTEDEQSKVLIDMGVRAHFIIGGDGTHLGAYDMTQMMKSKNWNCSVVGIPKTIDNDIPMLDCTFGFDTACMEAERAVKAAYVEATCNANCIGLVKLMGRNSGFIALNACLAARHADIVLLPEMKLSVDKVLEHCLQLMQTKGHCVVVVAEGCGDTLLQSCSDEVDGGGHKKLADVGPWLRDKIIARFKQVRLPLTVKYIDPTYMIRAISANANDSVYCAVLSHNAVHAAMAGFTGITIGQVNGRYVQLPIACVTKLPQKKVDLKGHWFQQLVSSTLQPDFTPEGYEEPVQTESVENPLLAWSEPLDVTEMMEVGDEVRQLKLEHLSSYFGKKNQPTTLVNQVKGGKVSFFDDSHWVTQTLGLKGVFLQMQKAGPRRSLHFKPDEVAATIVTCGGLCPGLNSVIRELVMMLYAYGVKKVYGIKGGYKGVCIPQNWVTLTPDNVKDIHMQGGSILVSDRGNPPHLEMAKVLKKKGVRQHFVLGGDGTQKGAYQTYEQMRNINWECSVVGIPKTIDNDINLLDRSFGFDTAMSEACKAIDVAYVEATCNANAIGLVKLMGRHCGYLTMMSVLAARHVDICLLPEMDICLDKVLDQCVQLLSTQGFAVVVVAEGCGDTLLSGTGDVDAGGNAKLSDVGVWLKDTVTSHFKSLKLPITIKYVDPTYMVRAVPANPNDSIYCTELAQSAVHAAMAGYTGVTVGKIDGHVVYLPIKMLTSMPSRIVDVQGRWFELLRTTTQQPNLEWSGAVNAKPIDPMKETSRQRSRRGNRGAIGTGLDVQDQLRVPDVKLTVVDGRGNVHEERQLARCDLIQDSDSIRSLTCFHLSQRYGHFSLPNPLPQKLFSDTFSWTTQSMFLGERVDSGKGNPYFKMTRAGPREVLHFDPNDPASAAAIVSCGGICPGLNCVIREVVNTLWVYGVRRIYGIKGGYKGVVDPSEWIILTPEIVKDIHLSGGTMLISDRGNPPHIEMAKTLQSHNIRQFFVLGGDGTHKGAMQTFDCMVEIDHECAVVGVPKTIDNDVPMFDQTFGFDTACTEAAKVVNSAYVEACCNANCIGLVKLMGRHCGFIAMNAALSARNVDICLIPEMDVDMEKVLSHVEHLMKTKGHAVIVVAEGCGDTLIKSELGKDAGGNKVLADVGPWMKDTIMARFKERGQPLTIKYIDPTYMIRSVPANSFDSTYCSVLGQMAVHGAMAGYSGITVGKVYERYCYLPIHAITNQKGKRVNPGGRWFWRMKEATKQPDFSPDVPAEKPAEKKTEKIDVLEALSTRSSINELVQPGDNFKRLEVVNLNSTFTPAGVENPLKAGSNLTHTSTSWSTQTLMRHNRHDDRGHVYYQLLRSGMREKLHFDPSASAACIVTCGGLCPGLNSVIREIVMTLHAYGVSKIFGCIGGYKGMVKPETWVVLTPEVVENIHKEGGTILVSDRGNPPHIEIAKTLQKMNIRQYFVIGGDGTQTGAFDTFTCTQEIQHEVAVVGVPKTIDNDIPVLDRSFGFNTACGEAEKAIASAYVEASCNANCIGLVKLMGRHCGFIACHATLSARSVDIVLLPEMDISLPRLLSHAMHLVKTKGRAVIVVAEGCGDTLLKSSGECDAGGNKKLADVGPWLKDQLMGFAKRMHQPLTIKYIDPTYTIRAVPANTNDSVYCSVLASHAVHVAMAGYTGVVVGKVDERYVMLPTHAITKSPLRRVDLKGSVFMRLMATTGQPSLAPGLGDDWALLPSPPPPRPEKPEVQTPLPIDFAQWTNQVGEERCRTAEAAASQINDVSLQIFDGFGALKEDRRLTRGDLLRNSDEVRKLQVMRLSPKYTFADVPSPLASQMKVAGFMDDDAWAVEAVSSADRVDSGSGRPYYQLLRAGPRLRLHFNPEDNQSCAAIVCCGGLCPGENVVIRGLFFMLKNYGVEYVYGIKSGFGGLPEEQNWVLLTEELVQDIHNQGGTILESERGNARHVDMAAMLKTRRVKQLFILGGDGAHKGTLQLATELQTIDHECALVAIPSTVDNDLPMVDSSFGFDTACTEARDCIAAAYVEATCNANCIGLVKLLGLGSGFLAMNATLASRNVDLCLLPEMEIDLEKVLDYCEQVMETKKRAVIVVADGAKESLFRLAGVSQEGDVGPWLRDQILARFKQREKPLTIKYIDPTYMVRSVKANAFDSAYCSALSDHAVHAAMAGFTCVTVAQLYQRFVYVPIHLCVQQRKRVNPLGRWFGRMLFTTGQPRLEPDGFEYQKGPSVDFKALSTPVALGPCFQPGSKICRMECVNLKDTFATKKAESRLKASMNAQSHRSLFLQDDWWSTQTFQRSGSSDTAPRTYLQLRRVAPSEYIHFDTNEPDAAAAIVTCGGLCPGLNNVIRELVNMLYAYGVKTVYGIIGGYKGCVEDDKWIPLTPDSVQDIHKQGGSILVSDRGNPPHSEIAKVMARRKIRQYFVLGGDGTHKGAMQSFEAMTAIGHECAVVGVPKTIDNDIVIVDRTFGFDTACTEARKAIDSAYVEATTNANCVGLVKLMGRHCGWIAATATIAARNADVCLIPEMDISLPKLMNHIEQVMRRKKYCVVVVAEGCGDTIISSTGETDAGGNKLLADVGLFLKDEITKHCKSQGLPCSIKYIDPTDRKSTRLNSSHTILSRMPSSA